MSSIFYVFRAHFDSVIYNVYIYLLLFFCYSVYIFVPLKHISYFAYFFLKIWTKRSWQICPICYGFSYSIYFTWASMWVLIPIKHNPWGSDGMCSVIYRCNVHRRNVQCCWTSNLFHLMLVHIQFACDHLIHCISHIMSCEMGNYLFTFLLVPSPIIALPCLVSQSLTSIVELCSICWIWLNC